MIEFYLEALRDQDIFRKVEFSEILEFRIMLLESGVMHYRKARQMSGNILLLRKRAVNYPRCEING